MSMHIESFHIESFKAIGDATFHWHPRVNILTGSNNSGKTGWVLTGRATAFDLEVRGDPNKDVFVRVLARTGEHEPERAHCSACWRRRTSCRSPTSTPRRP